MLVVGLRVGHSWRDKWTAISGPVGVVHMSRHKWTMADPVSFRSWGGTTSKEGYAREYLARYKGTLLVRKRDPLGPYRRPLPRVLGGGGVFLQARYPCRPGRARLGMTLEPLDERLDLHQVLLLLLLATHPLSETTCVEPHSVSVLLIYYQSVEKARD